MSELLLAIIQTTVQHAHQLALAEERAARNAPTLDEVLARLKASGQKTIPIVVDFDVPNASGVAGIL